MAEPLPGSTRQVLRAELWRRHDEALLLAERLADARQKLSDTLAESKRIRSRAPHGRIDDLQEALQSRDVIGQAKGMLMAAGLSADEAFDLLRRTSQLANRKLRDVAAGLVAQQATAERLEAPLERVRRASLAMEHHRAALATLAVERAEAAHEAIAGGMSPAEVARDLGITRQAVAKLLKHRGGDSRS